MPLTLKIPRRLDSPNVWQGRHWRFKHRLTQQWESAVWIQAAMATGQRVTLQDVVSQHLGGSERRKVRVTIERQVPSRRNFIRDDDNLRFASKPVLDALKRRGYLYDDSRQWLEHPTPTQSVSPDGKDYTIVTIEPCEPADDSALSRTQAARQDRKGT